MTTPRICFVGLQNLPLLAPEYGELFAGGAELQQTLLARALARRGWPVSMIVADHGQADGARWDGVRTYRAYRPNEGVRFLRFVHPRATRLWAAMKRADADVYYVSCASHLLAQVALFTRRHSRKLVFRIASNADCDPRAVLVESRYEKWMYRWGLERADLVLAQTAEQERALLANYARGSRVVGPLGDLGAERRAFSDRDIDVLWVGNLRKLKRPELLLETARRLPDLTFHMIGGPMRGAEAYFETVRTAAAALPNVTFHGRVPYHAVRGLYERAKVLAGTSEVEGFPNTYLQAWAHGAPVVAFLDPESLIVRHGLGARVDDVGPLREAIATLATNESEWRAVSGRCTRFVDERFGEDAMVNPYVEAFTELFPEPTQCNPSFRGSSPSRSRCR
jgi:glycosyltransferase involved in cell wall biosynthesis